MSGKRAALRVLTIVFATAACGGVSVATLLAQVPQAEADGSRSVWDGVYTAEQAARGEGPYFAACSSCHERENIVFPYLYGDSFIENWREDKLETLYLYTKTTMPISTPDSLGEETYLDILAAILLANGMPPGTEELTVGDLAGIRFEARGGPQPLPNLALIRTVGCMTSTPDQEWALTEASSPSRIRSAMEEVSAEEIEAARAVPVGTREFGLQNLDFFEPGFDPDPYAGQRVQVKGVLIRRSDGSEDINTLSLAAIDPSCTSQ